MAFSSWSAANAVV
ncbi:7a0b126b-2813-4d1b-8fd5-39305d5bb860 [Thermothielavioides terrestris]|uniref:7a0b126b-2813-4d1b-8fd5-39305d5bb860 n=1 Tax=Thermothielavioides terrestris TaxID=2587410 RepID=A0A3S4AKH9_9PEZI|nr:7a0b126b-2813-4d1b-8fd5-39305d5bb860 [Thermothielavioides terrestris]